MFLFLFLPFTFCHHVYKKYWMKTQNVGDLLETFGGTPCITGTKQWGRWILTTVGNGAGVSIRAKHRRVDPTPVVVKDSSASALVG